MAREHGVRCLFTSRAMLVDPLFTRCCHALAV